MRKLLIFVVLAVLIAGGTVLYLRQSTGPQVTYRIAPIERGDLTLTIGATGTLEPEEVVDVGAQIAGKIEVFGKDPHNPNKVIDYGTAVDEGTVLAHIDDSLYAADVKQATAQVDQAKANVTRSEADLEQMRVKLREAERNWTRAKELGPSKALSATDYDAYQAAYETGMANVEVGKAAVEQAKKGVAQAEAGRDRATANLNYCTIKSPVKGVIVDRRVNIGQTVVSSLNAPSLFLIAKDLKKMQVWASVNEADIGNIHVHQKVRFGVDAYPGELFRGEVGKIRLNATMTQNVVTYTVEINTDNSSGKLLPYLTANVQFEVDEHKDVLKAPNLALRFLPTLVMQIVPDARAEFAERIAAKASGRPSGSSRKPKEKKVKTEYHATIWVEDDELLRPISVTTGLNDSSATEIRGEGVSEGMKVVVGEVFKTGGDGTTNPFAPKLFGGRKQ